MESWCNEKKYVENRFEIAFEMKKLQPFEHIHSYTGSIIYLWHTAVR
jgi:hypothetical protein